ncbi:hypothetical protein LJC35_03345 [Parabacteroides sp. OttesenSCG-928-N08]|nr:hypothetical protein [Parabacteroides sp. OttesenSCG-928-N08]
MNTPPILFLIFNRPDTTTTVFNRIRKAKPTKLYVAADGARNEKEEELCKQTREIINQVDWECDVYTLFRDKNLGCKIAVSTAIDWFFQHEEQGIILEDDCLPDLSFFPFCSELLTKYKDDERVGHIGGQSFFPHLVSEGVSYDFSYITHIWGWATWKRVWQHVDMSLAVWNDPKRRTSLFQNKREEIYYTTFIEDVLNGRKKLNPWSIFYLFSLREQNQLSIYPSVNMVSNIGLNIANATHTSHVSKDRYVKEKEITFPLSHPNDMLPNHPIMEATTKRFNTSYKRILRYYFNAY